MITTAEKLGHGLYSVSEAAFYARIRTETLGRWLFGNNKGGHVLQPQFGFDSDKSVSFLDFVQALGVRSITTSPKTSRIPVGKIRVAVETAKRIYGIEYPLAIQHKVFVFGNDLVIETPKQELVQVSGRHKGNMVIKEIAELYMRKLRFGDDGFANLYHAWGQGNDEIVMNPQLRFGEPMFPEYGFTVETLFNAVATEGSIGAAAKCYEVPISAVETAIEYFDHLTGRSAA